MASLYDSNRDGVLDHKDEAWLKFYVWRDANGNGVVDEGEVKSLSEWGITSIKLTSDGQGQDAQGNWISGYGTYSKGETQFNIFADVGLSVSDIGYKTTETTNGQIVEFKAEDVELGPNPANDSLRAYRMFQANDLPLSMNLTQEGLAYDIVAGGKGDDVIGVENAGTGIYAGIDQEGTKAKQTYLAKAIAEISFRLTLAPDQATKDSLNTQLTQLNADYLIPVYLGYVLSGGEGNDRLTGGRGDDWISGDAGADVIKGADGDDILFVDSLDQVEGGKGHDIAFLMDKGFDQAHELNMGGQSLETVIGGEGNDWVKAGTPLDGSKAGIIIDGGNGDDYLTGGEYNDQLSGGAGIDTLLGGKGDDTILADEKDVIDGGEGIDIVQYATIEKVEVDASKIQAEILIGGYNDDRLSTSYDKPVALFGNDGDDLLMGSFGDDTLSGDAGEDVAKGAAGNDIYRFNRGDGHDTADDRFYYSKESFTGVNAYGEVQGSFTYGDVRITTERHFQGGENGQGEWFETIYTPYSATASVAAKVVTSMNVKGEWTHADGGTNDKVEFGAGITRNDLVFDLRGNDLYVGIKDTAHPNARAWELADGLKLANWLDLWDRVEKARFADGGEASFESLYLAAKGLPALPAADYAYAAPLSAGAADTSDDILYGNAGKDDSLKGGKGNDTYIFSRGAGWDHVLDEYKAAGIETRNESHANESFTLPVSYGHYVQHTKRVWENNDNDATSGGEDGAGESFASVVAGSGEEEDGFWTIVTYYEWQTDTTQAKFTGSWNTQINANVMQAQDAGWDVLRIDNTQLEELALRFQGDDLVVAFREGEKDFGSLADRVTLSNWRDPDHRVEVIRLLGNWDIHISGLDFAYAGDKGADIIGGSAGFDWLSGGGGDDILVGDDGYDILVGGTGDDLLSGGKIGDTIAGGEGNDTLDYSTSESGVTIDLNGYLGHGGDAQGDQFWGIGHVIGSAFNDVLAGNGADNRFIGGKGGDHIQGGAGQDWVSYAGSGAGVQVNMNYFTFTGGDAEGDDLGDIEHLIGSAYDDRLVGNVADNILIGGRGNDVLNGREGGDVASYEYAQGGVSADLAQGKGLLGEAWGDLYLNLEHLRGSRYNDRLTGDAGNNILEGKEGDDVLIGGAGADQLKGGQGFDDAASYVTSLAAVTVDLTTGLGQGGEAEGDRLTGIENLTGSDYNDHLTGDGLDNLLEGGKGADILDGGAGNDWASYAEAVTIDLLQGTASDGDRLTSIENVWASAFADSITGNDFVNRLLGAAGNDILYGKGGDDWLNGGEGNDMLYGGLGNDTVSYSFATSAMTVDLAANSASGGDGNDSLTGIENIEGSVWADKLTGNDLANMIDGGFGNDDLRGAKGDDTLTGGLGADTYRFGRGDGHDTLDAADLFPNQDRLLLDAGIDRTHLSFSRNLDDLLITLDQSGGQITVAGWFKGGLYQLDRVQLADGSYARGEDITHMAALAPTATLANYWHAAEQAAG